MTWPLARDLDELDMPSLNSSRNAPQNPGRILTSLSQADIAAATESMSQAANITKAAKPNKQTTKVKARSLSSSSVPSSQSLSPPTTEMSDPASTQATSPFEDSSGQNATPAPDPAIHTPVDPALLRRIIAALGTQPSAPAQPIRTMEHGLNPVIANATQNLVRVDDRISSLSGRGIKLPVKTRQGTKRAATSTLEGTEASGEAEDVVRTTEATPPPAKKLKSLKGPKRPDTLVRETKKPKQSMKPEASSNSDPKSGHFEQVVTGAALPKTAQEARAAAKSRYGLLEDEHKATMQSRAERARLANQKPDFLPEFFKTANFPKCRETDTVRCVCRAVADDGQEMIACDKCSVWQHNACMGGVVPDDASTAKYFCQVCDPWAHRELIARIRLANPLK